MNFLKKPHKNPMPILAPEGVIQCFGTSVRRSVARQDEVFMFFYLTLVRSCLEYHGWFQAPSLTDSERLGRVQCLEYMM